MEPPADNDHRGQHEGNHHDPHIGQKRPADQLDSSSSPVDGGRSHKQTKQETQSEVDLVAYSSPNNHGGESPVHNDPSETDRAAKPIPDSTEDPSSSEGRDMTVEYPSKPIEEKKTVEESKPLQERQPVEENKPNEGNLIEWLRGSSKSQAGEALASQPTSQSQDVQSDNLATTEAQIQVSEDDDLELPQEVIDGPVDSEKKFPDMDDYNEACAENMKLRKDNAKLRDQCQKLCGQIAVLQSNRPQSTPDEEEICSHWRILKFAIHNLTAQQFHGLPRRRATKEHQPFFQQLTPNPDDYLLQNSKPLFIEAAIWRLLMNKILNSPTSVYQIAAGNAIQTTEGVNRGQLLHMIYGDNGVYAAGGQCENQLADEMVRFFARYSSYVGPDKVKQQFLGIIQKAVALAKLMARSESRYVLCPKTSQGVLYGQGLDESWMDTEWEIERESDTGNGKVELVVSPALFKYVMPVEGKDKQESKLLFKARVCW
ncbi:hypothetical protein SLS62_004650 [Diatrype stigma]|uniref:Uncharacterized protein n=1 Tax=Diatrype stigma TaxID=117547 RepID=A0AAN9UQW9_9PEZI